MEDTTIMLREVLQHLAAATALTAQAAAHCAAAMRVMCDPPFSLDGLEGASRRAAEEAEALFDAILQALPNSN